MFIQSQDIEFGSTRCYQVTKNNEEDLTMCMHPLNLSRKRYLIMLELRNLYITVTV